ncbi:MAG TPA: 3-methyl-2-oxobutanoate dehydrogenase subunit VorB [Anaerolineaceae bacterium]|nr:3-methyl-2-oxobutanoate dehydrogenase subunit VorB [Anaerolineaceae bacterium]
MSRQLWKGNEAVAEAAIRAGLVAYFGYPITPQTELLEYMSRRLPQEGRVFLQAESELGAVNMVYGAACTGVRVMSSSSSPGISLMMEGLSYMAGTEIPAVLVDVMRGGPGLGNIAPAQSDYNQAIHGGGHGDYFPIVLAPASVQEAVDLTGLAFDLAEKYRSICIILSDGSLGQMMEPAEMPEYRPVATSFADWAVRGEPGRDRRNLSSINLDPPAQERTNFRLLSRWAEVQANEVRFKGYYLDDAKFAVVGFGSAGRVALTAVRQARAQGIPVGLLRPITLAPFPEKVLRELAEQVDGMLVVEMNAGQMLDDVRRVVGDRTRVEFFGRLGGVVPFPDEVYAAIQRLSQAPARPDVDPRASWLALMKAGGVA